ncbi:hypothetical protein [Thiocystis violacea]|uniref:hypothetical protein n=1 Tax=Thiocystis violacea TaxID=13725 RepID=UPI001902C4DF|nr:hypothetical protein [Thiocystis violacea]MBK1722949.1 hypothetical protein [Thiocystis violacea]
MEAADNKHERLPLAVYLGETHIGFAMEDVPHIADKPVPPGKLREIPRRERLSRWAISVKRRAQLPT